MAATLIAPATPRHATGIYELAAAVRYTYSDADENRGFLVLPGSPDWWAEALSKPNASRVAMRDGRVVGFVYAPHEADGDVLKIDRIAVHPRFARRGIAQKLLDAASAAVSAGRTYAYVMHGPKRNRASEKFFRDRNGFELVEETSEAGIDGEFVWGRYERSA